MSNSIQFSDVEPLLVAYHEKKIGEIIHHPDADPIIKYCKLVGKDIAGGTDEIIVNVIDDGESVQSEDYELADGAIGAYKFKVTPNTMNWRATVTQKAIDAAGNETNGLYNVLKDSTTRQIRMTMDKFAQRAMSIHGAIGKVVSKGSGYIVLGGVVNGVADATLLNRVAKNMKLVFAASADTGYQKGTNVGGYGDVVNVDSWDYNTAKIFSASDLTNVAAVDFIFEKGSRYYAASTGRRAIAGVPEWFAATLATSQTLYGQDRSVSVSLQAHTMDCSGMEISEALLKGRKLLRSKLLGSPDTVWMATDQYQILEKEQGKSAVFEVNITQKGENGRTLTLGLSAIKLSDGNGGFITCVELPRQESGVFYMFNNARNPFVVGYTDQMVRTHTVGGMWRAVEGGVVDKVTGEKIAGYRCEGSINACFYASGAGAGESVVGYSFFWT